MITLTENSNIRRIDELGRIVIPKDIRKRLHIKDSEPLEIFIENGEIRIKKYSVLKEDREYIEYLIDTWSRLTGNKYIITDRESVYSATVHELSSKKLSKELQELVFDCKEEKNVLKTMNFEEVEVKGYTNIYPLIVNNDRIGLLIEYNETNDLQNTVSIRLLKNLLEEKVDF